MSLTLEQEFEQFKAIHKYAILKAKIMNYYQNIQDGQVNIPNFMRSDSPEKLADRDLRNLILNDTSKFNYLYELAYQELSEVLP